MYPFARPGESFHGTVKPVSGGITECILIGSACSQWLWLQQEGVAQRVFMLPQVSRSLWGGDISQGTAVHGWGLPPEGAGDPQAL